MTKRLFVATVLSKAESTVLLELKADLEPLFAEWWKDCQFRWVRPEKLHITWLFIGDCDTKQEAAICKSLTTNLAAVSKLSLNYDRLEVFGSKSRPNALVLIPQIATDEVQQLGALLREGLGHYCQRQEDLLFRPHITLFRFPQEYNGEIELQEQWKFGKYLPLQQEITSISLIQSHFGTQRDAYEQIADFKLLDG